MSWRVPPPPPPPKLHDKHEHFCASSTWDAPTCVYVTLLAGAPHVENSIKWAAAGTITRNGSTSNNNYFRQTVCLQQRLRHLNASFPLLVLHNFDEDLSPYFDRVENIESNLTRALADPYAEDALKSRAARSRTKVRHNKFQVWALVRYKRIIFIDSLCCTPNRCSSSTTKRPRSLNFTPS